MSRMNALSVKQLRLVALLGDVQSIQIAASLLGMTQSTATKSLQKIESLLEIQLFHRTNKGILPTRAGLTFLGHAKTILQSVDRADKDIQNIRHGRKGELALGAPIGASRAALQKAIVLHAKKYQDIVVNVKEAPSLDLHAMLVARELDCVIGRRAQPCLGRMCWFCSGGTDSFASRTVSDYPNFIRHIGCSRALFDKFAYYGRTKQASSGK